MDEKLFNTENWVVLADAKCAQMRDVTVNFSSSNNKKAFPAADKEMENIWALKVVENIRLFNQSKFRLADAYSSNSRLHLVIGLTDYRETFCTNLLPSSDHIKNFGQSEYGSEDACFGHATGVGGVVVTQDGFIILQKRAHWVSESQGCYDTPGGHSEPDEMMKKLRCMGSDSDVKYDSNETDSAKVGVEADDGCSKMYSVNPDDVVYELFHSFIREVRDEVNVPESCLSWPILLGVNRNKRYGCKPGLIFYVKCSLSKDQVEKMYEEGGPETDESTEIKFMPLHDLLNSENEKSEGFLNSMAPLGYLALLFYKYYYKQLSDQETS